MRFSILLPSAEGKQPGGNPLAPDMFDYRASNTFNFFSDLNPERRTLIQAVQAHVEAADEDAREALFGVRGDTLAAAVEATRHIFGSPLLAAIDRYSPGVMYRATEFTSLPTGAQRRLLENGIIFSGLFGLLRPDDLIPDYKLSMGAKVDGIGKVSAYWKPHLTARLAELLDGQAVWNLLPGSHDEAWEDTGAAARVIRVKFVREVDGERKPISHGVKELRGALAAYIVNETADHVDALDFWEAPDGYELDREASDLDERGGGTAVLVSAPGWEARRDERRRLRAEALAARTRPSEDEDDD